MTTPGRKQTMRQKAQKHGHYARSRTLDWRGIDGLDRRTVVGRAARAWGGDLTRDLGGPETVTTGQRALISMAVKSWLLLSSLDEWLLKQPSLVNARRRSVYPVVLQRCQLADSLLRTLNTLGLERRMPAAPTLAGYLATRSDLVSTPTDAALPPVAADVAREAEPTGEPATGGNE